VVVIAAVEKRERFSLLFERRELLHQAALAPGSIILVNDAFLGGLIERADGFLGGCRGFLAGFLGALDLDARFLNSSPGAATVHAILNAFHIILFITLDCRLNISQTEPPKLIERGLILP
jgi:predicted methyltransferase MtxX (methanogen marker protein 4)